MDDTTLLLAALVVLLLVLAVVGLLAPKLKARKHSKDLKEQFGPEYEREVTERDDPAEAEAELERRKAHRDALDIQPLEPAARERYIAQWREVQKRFVDAPGEVIDEANDLVTAVMRERGYPVDDFEQRADDLSVDHPGVVDDYRQAHRITVANRRGEADTENLRLAVMAYRSLFARLLEHEDTPDDAPRSDAGTANKERG